MPRNGSGAYSLPSGNPVVTGTTISSTTHNNTMSDIATALTASIAKDGQTTPTANLPMGGYKHTGVAVAASLTDYARTDQVQNSAFQWLSSVSGADTITASASPVPSAYAAGQTFRFVSAGANTGVATLNISSLGAKAITKNGTTALVAGDIPSGAVITVVYDGTQFQLCAVSGNIGTAVGGALALTDATDATSSTAAALKTAGGLAVAKKAFIGTLLDLSTSTAGQIKYPATQNPSADANTLDDYEESDSWTPSIRGDTGGAWSGQTGTFEGTYTKKGREVTAHFRVALTNKGTPAGTYAFLAGLPFAAANKGFLGGTIYYFSGLAANWISVHGVLINGGDTTAYLYGRKAATAAAGSDLVAVTDIGNTTEIRGTVIYHV